MAMTLKLKPNDTNGSVQKRQYRKNSRQVRSNVKVFFDCNGVVHRKFLPRARTVNKEYYLKVMRQLCEAIRQKRTELWKNQS